VVLARLLLGSPAQTEVEFLDNSSPLAKAGIPLLHVCDRLDPWLNEQTRVVEKRFKELVGQITVIINEGSGPYSFTSADQARAVDFIVGKAK